MMQPKEKEAKLQAVNQLVHELRANISKRNALVNQIINLRMELQQLEHPDNRKPVFDFGPLRVQKLKQQLQLFQQELDSEPSRELLRTMEAEERAIDKLDAEIFGEPRMHDSPSYLEDRA